MARFATLLALFALVAVAFADIKFDEGDDKKVVLASFGDADASVSVLYKGPAADVEVAPSSLFSVGTISSADSAGGYTNYTIPLSFDKGVGSGTYTVTIGDESVTGSCVVAGFVILADGNIVSGDDGDGVSAGQEGSSTYDVKAVDTDGSEPNLSGCSITAKELSGPYMKEVDMGKTSLSADSFTLAISQYRVGTGSFIVNFECDSIERNGESFETVLRVTQQTSPEPPCVAIGGDITTTDGYLIVPMFNLLTPPKGSPVRKVEVTIDGESAEWDKSKSDLSLPDQSVYFKISAAGTASITCDGEPAATLGGDVVASGDTSTPALATDLVAELPESETDSSFTAIIRVINSSPTLLTKAEGQLILDKFCSTIGGSNCVIEKIVEGSAVLTCSGHVPADSSEESEADLEESFRTCDFQSSTNYACEGEIELGDIVVQKAVAGAVGAVAAGGGLATWTIVVIALVGAFALILVIVLGLWAVYRRSAEQSESDYSSSGPLGVPDPSDLLYEQSIVRDIYGRGDFPDGGPSQAVAEQRAREAALREEFPRPPSSSGLSRGTGTDDASSTYSV